jgi:hypothetical protein
MRDSIKVFNSKSSASLGNYSKNDAPSSVFSGNAWLNLLEEREDIAIFTGALIQLKYAKRSPERAGLLDWNNVRDEW